MSTLHKANIEKARKLTGTIRSIKNNRARLSYLRKIDPYVFEELVLNSLSNSGYRIQRNDRYSGDGGIDGKVISRGGVILIQSKRYSNHINASDVKDFARVCKQNKSYGLFVHTGRTGRLAKQHKSKNIDIISGERLLKLVCKSRVTPKFPLSYKLRYLLSYILI